MGRTHFLLLLGLMCVMNTSSVQAQDKCPQLDVFARGKEVYAGEPFYFFALLSNLPANAKPKFKWQLSGVAITTQHSEGPDPFIIVETTNFGGTTIKATVEVSGLPAGCPAVASNTAGIRERLGEIWPFDMYGDIKPEDENARLDNFAIQLRHQVQDKGYLVGYAGRLTYPGEAQERLERAKQYLVRKRGIAANRLITIDGGHQEALEITLIILPESYGPPMLRTPLPRSEIQLTKPRPKSQRRKR